MRALYSFRVSGDFLGTGTLTCGLRKRQKQTRMPVTDYSFGSCEVRGFLFESEDEKEAAVDKMLASWKQVMVLNKGLGSARRVGSAMLSPRSSSKKSNKITVEATGRLPNRYGGAPIILPRFRPV